MDGSAISILGDYLDERRTDLFSLAILIAKWLNDELQLLL